MSDLRSIVEAARTLEESGEQPLLATVVAVHGSAYRKPGARMVFSSERWLAGSVSAGCLERDVVAKGAWRTRDGRPHVVTYDGSHDERIGTGCDGIIDVLVERTGGSRLTDPLHLIGECLARELRAVLITVFRAPGDETLIGSRLARMESGDGESTVPAGPLAEAMASEAARVLSTPRGRPYTRTIGDVHVLVEPLAPPVHLFVFGSLPDAVPLVSLAQAVGWTVSVCDERSQVQTRERFRHADQLLLGSLDASIEALERCARPAVVTMQHHYERDLATLDRLLHTRVPYLGVLGSRVRSGRLFDDLRARGHVLDDAAMQRIHAPVGLAMGAESPREIALSIVAEVQSVLAAHERLLTVPALERAV